MKKGFTLIELLAVILILGIIALIAIPTVKNIISEARSGQFKSGSDNIMKTVQQTCQLILIKGDKPLLTYSFSNGEIDTPIDIKGELPQEGFIILNNECTLENYHLEKNNLIYSNIDYNDYMLKKPTNDESIFKTMYPTYYDNIVTIDFLNDINIPNNAIEIKDPSVTGNNKIKSWLVQDGENYKLYVGSLSTIYGNFDSSNLFSYLSKVTNINLSNFNTSNVVYMKQMFDFCINLESIDVTNFDISKVTSMMGMFRACKKLRTLDLSTWKCNGNYINATKMFGNFNINIDEACINLETIIFPTEKNSLYFSNINHMFATCEKINNLDLRGFNTDEVVYFNHVFYGCLSLTNLDISSWNTSNAWNFAGMFQYCTSLESIDVSHFDTHNVRTMHTLFHACYKLKSLDLNFDTSNVTDMSYMFGHMREITYLNISKLNTEKVTNMKSMFGNIFVLNELDISNLNVSNVENIDSLFVNSNIKKIYLDSWQLPKLTTYEDLFTDGLFKEISIKNSNYNTINKFISQLPTMTNESKGTLTITGVDDLSKVNTAGANEKFWNVI